VGCFLGLRPGRRNSGLSEPQLHISKERDRYLRTLLVQGAHYIFGPFGEDSDLRRWGLKLAERGGKNAKKRAVVAVARKLTALLHKLWVSGEVCEPLRTSQSGGCSSIEKRAASAQGISSESGINQAPSDAGVPCIACFRLDRAQPLAEFFKIVGDRQVRDEFHALVAQLARDPHAQRAAGADGNIVAIDAIA
jgi:Transposase IS116/IS110/IS902 family